jgi:hypothetical protein
MITPVAQLFAGLLAISQSVPSDETASVSLALKYTGLDRVHECVLLPFSLDPWLH